MQRWLVRLVAVTLLLARSAAAGAAAQENDLAAAKELLRLVNQERAQAGLAALDWDDRLAAAAFEHAREMVARGELSHRFAGEAVLRGRVAATGLRFDRVGENVAYNTGLTGAHDGLMRSPGHRANILDPKYNAAGMAVVRRGRLLYVAQNFARRYPEYSTRDAEELILASMHRGRAGQGKRPVPASPELYLRQAACQMAKDDKLDSRKVVVRGTLTVVAYTVANPADLPAGVEKMLRQDGVRSIAVGSCYARSPSYVSGIHWVVVVLYQ